MIQPLVSIVIPTYNRAHLITAALDSCLMQTYPHIEIIVVDDGSTDNTLPLLADQYGERVRVISQRNQGPAIARNQGAAEARGEFIQFCDTDDQLYPEKVQRCLAEMQGREDVAVVYTRFRYVAADGVTPLPLPPSPLLDDENIFCELLHGNGTPIQTSTTFIRKTAFDAVGGFRADEQHRCAEDWDLFLRLAAVYRFSGVDAVMVDYRRHDGGITADPYLMAQGRLLTVRYARDYAGRKNCLDDAAYNQLEADRYHVLALTEWERGQRQAAREAFQQAIHLSPQGAKLRRLYIGLSYLFPASITQRVNQWARLLR